MLCFKTQISKLKNGCENPTEHYNKGLEDTVEQTEITRAWRRTQLSKPKMGSVRLVQNTYFIGSVKTHYST